MCSKSSFLPGTIPTGRLLMHQTVPFPDSLSLEGNQSSQNSNFQLFRNNQQGFQDQQQGSWSFQNQQQSPGWFQKWHQGPQRFQNQQQGPQLLQEQQKPWFFRQPFQPNSQQNQQNHFPNQYYNTDSVSFNNSWLNCRSFSNGCSLPSSLFWNPTALQQQQQNSTSSQNYQKGRYQQQKPQTNNQNQTGNKRQQNLHSNNLPEVKKLQHQNHGNTGYERNRQHTPNESYISKSTLPPSPPCKQTESLPAAKYIVDVSEEHETRTRGKNNKSEGLKEFTSPDNSEVLDEKTLENSLKHYSEVLEEVNKTPNSSSNYKRESCQEMNEVFNEELNDSVGSKTKILIPRVSRINTRDSFMDSPKVSKDSLNKFSNVINGFNKVLKGSFKNGVLSYSCDNNIKSIDFVTKSNEVLMYSLEEETLKDSRLENNENLQDSLNKKSVILKDSDDKLSNSLKRKCEVSKDLLTGSNKMIKKSFNSGGEALKELTMNNRDSYKYLTNTSHNTERCSSENKIDDSEDLSRKMDTLSGQYDRGVSKDVSKHKIEYLKDSPTRKSKIHSTEKDICKDSCQTKNRTLRDTVKSKFDKHRYRDSEKHKHSVHKDSSRPKSKFAKDLTKLSGERLKHLPNTKHSSDSKVKKTCDNDRPYSPSFEWGKLVQDSHRNSERHKVHKSSPRIKSESNTVGDSLKRTKLDRVHRQDSTPLKSSRSEKYEEVNQGPPKKFKDHTLRNSTSPRKCTSSPAVSETFICYICKEKVKEYRATSHLYFGSLQCCDCDHKILSCKNFRRLRRSMYTNKDTTSCSHKFLSWFNDPLSFLKNRIKKELILKTSRSSKVMGTDIVKGVSLYVKCLGTLECSTPWKSAIRRMRKFIASEETLDRDLIKANKGCVLSLCSQSQVETKPERDNRCSEGKYSSKSKGEGSKNDLHKNDLQVELTQRQPSLLESLLPSEPQTTRDERIPQEVEEEAIIPMTEWEVDVIPLVVPEHFFVDEANNVPVVMDEASAVENVEDPGGASGSLAFLKISPKKVTSAEFVSAKGDEMEEVITREVEPVTVKGEVQPIPGQELLSEGVSSDEVAAGVANILSEVEGKEEFECKETKEDGLVTDEMEEMSFITEEVRELDPEMISEEAAEYMEHVGEDVSEVDIVPEVEDGEDEPEDEDVDDFMDKIELDITQAGLEDVSTEIKTDGEPKKKSQDSGEVNKSCKMEEENEDNESQVVKRYNLRSRRHRHTPSMSFLEKLDEYEKKQLWKHILPAAKAFHENSMRDKKESLHLTFNSEEANDEFMVDILLSQTYGLEQLDEVTEYISVGDSKSESIVSRVKDAIENSPLFLNTPGFIPPTHLTRATSRALLRSYARRRIPERNKRLQEKEESVKTTPPNTHHPEPLLCEDDLPRSRLSKVHIVAPPPDGYYYVVTYPRQPCPKECPMCYYRIFPSMFSLNLLTNLATARCFGCPLTIYVVHEPVDTSLPKIIFSSNKKNKKEYSVGDRGASEEIYNKPKPARYKKPTTDKTKRRRLSIEQFIKT
ncbi:hypothetical protein Hamer_G024412 [Homarus americanus]|uniref:Uncharacterized protein n=1 Tax=Homarus americanus TaxID=6706 RepID=A0A8J5J842_HOMAM|nr:hypothetical protein Hamer_G024412 [Homarus americanus]